MKKAPSGGEDWSGEKQGVLKLRREGAKIVLVYWSVKGKNQFRSRRGKSGPWPANSGRDSRESRTAERGG